MKNSIKFALCLLGAVSIFASACGDDVTQSNCKDGCAKGLVCDENSGKCVTEASKCKDECTDGMICNEETGNCVTEESKCKDECTNGMICNEETGKCITEESKCKDECTDGLVCDENSGKCVTEGSKCRDGCAEGMICNEETGNCMTEGSKCRDGCAEGMICNEETGECAVIGGDDKCEGFEILCGETCVNLMSNPNYCGSCEIKCNEGFICNDGQCVDPLKECEDNILPSCENNSSKACVNGRWVATECQNQVCLDGTCVDPEVTKECDDELDAICVNNVAKKCVDGKWVNDDCQNKKCINGACSEEEIVPDCQDDMIPTCDENNNIKSCSGQLFAYQPCGSLTCVEGKCEEVNLTECDETFETICEGNGIKKCVDGFFELETCEGSQYCKNALCVASAIKDLCPDDPAKTLPGICGCGIPDTINENSGNPYCLEINIDFCPSDNNKKLPGLCGCNVPDIIDSFTHEPLCNGLTQDDPPYNVCLESNTLMELTNCLEEQETTDFCPTDDHKMNPGICGCGIEDNEENILDTDGDGLINCLDQCPTAPDKFVPGSCGCHKIRVKIDGTEYCATPIYTANDLLTIKDNINNNSNPNNDPVFNTIDDVYAIMNDINLYDAIQADSVEKWVGFKNFKGQMLSLGKTISYKKADGTHGILNCSTKNCGLFHSIAGGLLQNFNIEFDMNTTDGMAGLLAGFIASSTIRSINVKGNITGKGHYLGGVIGSASYSHILDISQEGDVTNTGARTGGVLGDLTGGGSFTSVLSKGNVIGGDYTGGLVGRIEDAAIVNAKNEGKTIGSTYVAGIAGYGSEKNNPYKNLSNVGDVEGDNYIAGIVGSHSGDLIDVTNDGNIISTVVETVFHVHHVGGIVAYNKGAITNAINKGSISITGLGYHAGGIVGTNAGNIKNATNHANITAQYGPSYGSYWGGIVGDLSGLEHSNLTNYGNITLTAATTTGGGNPMVGGIAARLSNTEPSTLSDAHNYGNLNGGSNGGVLLGGTLVSLINVSNSSNTNTAGIIGNWTSTDPDVTATIRFEGLKNTGDVSGARPGGIAAIIRNYSENVSIVMNNIVNTGNVTDSSHSTGGFFSIVQTISDFSLTHAYSTGNVKGRNQAAGLIGIFHTSNKDILTSTSYKVTKDRTVNINFDKIYTTGDVSGALSPGGLFGYIDLNLGNYMSILSGKTLTCNDLTQAQPTLYKYRNANLHFKITNAYATGLVKGTGDYTGGLIGQVYGTSSTTSYTNKTYSFDADCNLQTEEDTYEATRTIDFTLANAFAAGNVTSPSKLTGGLVGYYNYKNNLDDPAYNSIVNNVYATGSVPANAGNLIGNKPTGVTFKNTYYWASAGATKGATNAGSIPELIPFDYVDDVPHISGELDVDLIDQLNNNITTSTSPELSPAKSASWISKMHDVSETLHATLPFPELPPIIFDWE